jgi:hypothetical protein
MELRQMLLAPFVSFAFFIFLPLIGFAMVGYLLAQLALKVLQSR